MRAVPFSGDATAVFFCLAKLFDGLGEIYSLLGRFADYHSFFLYKDPKIDLRIY